MHKINRNLGVSFKEPAWHVGGEKKKHREKIEDPDNASQAETKG
jgi:hypothetical protein